MTQICITKIAAKCILVVVVKWLHRANVLLERFESALERLIFALSYSKLSIASSAFFYKGVIASYLATFAFPANL